MKKLVSLIIAAGLVLGLGVTACQNVTGIGGDARSILHAFCSLKQTSIAQLLLSPAQRQAGQVVCQAIGDPLGTP